jgi:hypothetical protein
MLGPNMHARTQAWSRRAHSHKHFIVMRLALLKRIKVCCLTYGHTRAHALCTPTPAHPRCGHCRRRGRRTRRAALLRTSLLKSLQVNQKACRLCLSVAIVFARGSLSHAMMPLFLSRGFFITRWCHCSSHVVLVSRDDAIFLTRGSVSRDGAIVSVTWSLCHAMQTRKACTDSCVLKARDCPTIVQMPADASTKLTNVVAGGAVIISRGTGRCL